MTSVTDFVIVYCMLLKIHLEVRPNSTGAAMPCYCTSVSSSSSERRDHEKPAPVLNTHTHTPHTHAFSQLTSFSAVPCRNRAHPLGHSCSLGPVLEPAGKRIKEGDRWETPANPVPPTEHQGWNVRTPHVHLRLDRNPCDGLKTHPNRYDPEQLSSAKLMPKTKEKLLLSLYLPLFSISQTMVSSQGLQKNCLKECLGKTGNNAAQWQSTEN